MLVENTLFGVHNKVSIAIEILREFEPPEGYYLAFSGGKDSQCVYHLAVMAGVKFDAHFNFTSVDPPEVLRFIRTQYPDVKWNKPELNMWQLIVKNGVPPTRQWPYCCEMLKETAGVGRVVITGVRREESNKRKNRSLIKHCIKQGKSVLNPILNWIGSDVWEYLNGNHIPHCSLYDDGNDRIGCVLCAKMAKRKWLKDVFRYPNYVKAYKRTFNKMLLVWREKGRPRTWDDGDEVFDWWVKSRDTYTPPSDPNQIMLW